MREQRPCPLILPQPFVLWTLWLYRGTCGQAGLWRSFSAEQYLSGQSCFHLSESPLTPLPTTTPLGFPLGLLMSSLDFAPRRLWNGSEFCVNWINSKSTLNLRWKLNPCSVSRHKPRPSTLVPCSVSDVLEVKWNGNIRVKCIRML